MLNMTDIYFWRQLFVLSAGLLYSLCVGFTLAFPAVLNPAITSQNSTDIRTTGDHASWIAAINGLGGIIGSIGLSPIMQIFGRKAAHNSINAFLLIGWIILPFANNISVLYAARFIQGISIGNVYINCIIISEYTHPKRRGYFIVSKKAAIALGSLCCHAMDGFYSWRQIAIFAAVLPFLSIIMILFWPESPSYLAMTGRFLECKNSFRWLHGNSVESENHLKALIDAQTKLEYNHRRTNFVGTLKTFLNRDFQKALLISSVLTLALDLCGRYYFIAYAIQIMTTLLNNKDLALHFTLGADLFILIALILSSFVVIYAKRRTILLSSGTVSVILMAIISVLIYLNEIYKFSVHFLIFTALVIILQCFVVNIGLIPIAFTLVGEIFPLEYKGMGAGASGIVFGILYGVFLKVTPILMENTGLYGTYAIYAVLLTICLLLLYKTVPETKDKTLQDIEDEIKGVRGTEMALIERKSLVA